MKKLFFFKSSSNGTDKHLHRKKPSENIDHVEVSGDAALRRSHSLSSTAFLVETSSNDLTRSDQNRQRNHVSRCFDSERRLKEAEARHMYTSTSLSTCSSNVLDRYIDGEEHLERSIKSGSSRSNLSGRINGSRRRVQSPSPLSDKPKSKGTTTRLKISSTDLRDASSRSLARSVVQRLSHSHGKASSYEPIRIHDVYGGCNGETLDSDSDVFATEHCEVANDYTEHLHGKNRHMGSKYVDSELERKYKEAEKRVKLFSEELEEQRFFSDRDFDTLSLVEDIRRLEEERVGLASEVLSLLRSQLVEREQIRRAKADINLHIKRQEKEKRELQFELEKEIDRRSNESTSKFEKLELEEKRLRERVRELSEQNVSLQREVSTFHEKETERIDAIRHLDERNIEFIATVEEMQEENLYLEQTLSKLQESYNDTAEDLEFLKSNFEEKDNECRELHKSVTRFLRTCNEQEKTIQGLRDGFSEETDDYMVKRLQMEQIRLVGVELSLRKEVESIKLEADSLRNENTCLLNRVDAGDMNFKLDNEMKMRVCHLQDQGVSMLNESTQLCYKLLKFIKEKLAQDTQSMDNGLSEHFLIESEMRVHGIRRGTESLKRSLETVTSLLLEKSSEVASNCSNNQSAERSLRAELRAETLITSLLREKLYSMEQEIQQLQAEVAAGVRGNEILQCEIQNSLDNFSINTHQLKDLKLQMAKKEEKINRLETNLQEAAKDLSRMKVTLPNVLKEREHTWREVRECRERNMVLESEKEMLEKKLEKLEEDVLFKEGQITILKDTLSSKHFDLLSSPEFSYNDFLVQ